MNRFLHWFNLIGVLVLVGVCVFQWRLNRQLNFEVNRLERQRFDQASQMEQAEAVSSGQASDLESLRVYLGRLTGELKQARDQLTEAERNLRQLEAEREQLKTSVTNWTAAVSTRNERLEEAAHQIKALAEARDNALDKFNDLAKRHNVLVTQWNELQARLAAGNPVQNTNR